MNQHEERRLRSGERVTGRPSEGVRVEHGGPPNYGREGGSYGYDQGRSRDVEIPEALNLRRDRVRWGPIVAGFLTALTSLLLLSLLGLAIGLTAVNAGDVAAQRAAPEGSGMTSAIWGAVSAFLSFLLGGFVAARTAAVFGRGWGALNGLMVFMLAVPLTLWLAGQGMGAVLGSLGNFASGLSADPGQAQGAADQARQATANVQPADAARAAAGARNAAWGTLAGTLLGLLASALGGLLGTRREVELDRGTGRISD